MSRVLIVYRQRLGDIVGCLPAARHLAAGGHEVDFCCFPQYHSLFGAVSYCRPVGPEALRHRSDYDHVYDLEIRRREYDAYRASQRKWRDYVYAKYPDLEPARTLLPYFDRAPIASGYALPERYNLACPKGISQVPSVDGEWFHRQCLALSPGPWYILTEKLGSAPSSWAKPLQARSLDHLPSLIAGADLFVTINSAPNYIATGVRKTWHLVYESGFCGQSNYEAPGQIILHQPPELARYSWRFWVHHWRRRLTGQSVEHDFS
ncbi:MAG: hypothetical protein LV479_01800 [Methylacidiphilales bacterium]|nr:hypothetical protein [Candidatus Methylacidiphilales bacterium]